MKTKTKKKKPVSPGPAIERKMERRRYLASLYRKGIPRTEIYRQITGKFGVSAQTVRKDVTALGLSVQKFFETEAEMEAEIGAALDRLRSRAQREDAVGNRADELILNLLGSRSMRGMQHTLRQTEARIKTAQARLLEAKADLARESAGRIQTIAEPNGWQTKFSTTLSQIAESGAIQVSEILGMITAYLSGNHAGDGKQVLSMLRMMLEIATIDGGGGDPDSVRVVVPEGMRLVPPELDDDGDELMADA